VTERGNWEDPHGHSPSGPNSILNLPKPLAQAARLLGRDEPELRRALDEDRARLLAARDLRVPPGKDTKVLTSWNGLMLAALADGAWILGDERYVAAARQAAAFLLDTMRTPEGLLLHSFKDGQAKFNGYLDDYACLIDGLTRPVRGDRRGALDRGGRGPDRGDARGVPGRRRGGVLLHGPEPRDPDHPSEGRV
jgi:uncharacterized protein YyaL (SSP411 family)